MIRDVAGVDLIEWTDAAGGRHLDSAPCTLFRGAGVAEALSRQGWDVSFVRLDSQMIRVRARVKGVGPYR